MPVEEHRVAARGSCLVVCPLPVRWQPLLAKTVFGIFRVTRSSNYGLLCIMGKAVTRRHLSHSPSLSIIPSDVFPLAFFCPSFRLSFRPSGSVLPCPVLSCSSIDNHPQPAVAAAAAAIFYVCTQRRRSGRERRQ